YRRYHHVACRRHIGRDRNRSETQVAGYNCALRQGRYRCPPANRSTLAKGGHIMLNEAVDRHIELYRSMGFKYKVQAYMLHSFADFAQERSEEFIQTDSVLEWAASAPSVRQRHDRLLTVRRLACTLNAEDKRHQVPPTDVFGRTRRRRTCHIFTQDEIDRLLRAASQLMPTESIRPVTYTAL